MTYEQYKTLIEQCGVHAALGPTGEGWGIEQNPHELAKFLVMTERLGIQTVLEIGTGYRAGLARFMTEVLGWQVTTLDRWMPDTPAPLARQVIGMSQDEAIREQVRGKYDLVIIDADHDYEAVVRDFQFYALMAAKAVMFHDIAGLRDCEGAARFWRELQSGWVPSFHHDGYQVIAEGDQRAGIGWRERRYWSELFNEPS